MDHQDIYLAAALAALASRHGRHSLRANRHPLVRPYVVLCGVA